MSTKIKYNKSFQRSRYRGPLNSAMCDVRDYLRALDALALHGNNGGISMTGDQFSMLLKPLEHWVDAVMDDLQRLPTAH